MHEVCFGVLPLPISTTKVEGISSGYGEIMYIHIEQKFEEGETGAKHCNA
jgi:hypothetical protein